MIISKFGGSSLTRKKYLKNINILSRSKERQILIFSAIGKQNKHDKKLTDLLIEYVNTCSNVEKTKLFKRIVVKFKHFCKLNGTSFDIQNQLEKCFNRYNKTKDAFYLISRGEYYTALFMARCLKIKFIPAEKVVLFSNGHIDLNKTKYALSKILIKYKKIVVPGFYGIDENGKIKLFSRGGGDLTGALLAVCGEANVYENWTDVDGIYEVNPKICKSKKVKNMSYNELVFITSHDAKVIQYECAKLLQNTSITLKVGSIINLKQSPTVITSNCVDPNTFMSYENKKNEYTIYIYKNRAINTIQSNAKNHKKEIKRLYKNIKNSN